MTIILTRVEIWGGGGGWTILLHVYMYVICGTVRCHNVLLHSLASQPYFSAYAHARAKVGGGREGKIRLGRPARFL